MSCVECKKQKHKRKRLFAKILDQENIVKIVLCVANINTLHIEYLYTMTDHIRAAIGNFRRKLNFSAYN